MRDIVDLRQRLAQVEAKLSNELKVTIKQVNLKNMHCVIKYANNQKQILKSIIRWSQIDENSVSQICLVVVLSQTEHILIFCLWIRMYF